MRQKSPQFPSLPTSVFLQKKNSVTNSQIEGPFFESHCFVNQALFGEHVCHHEIFCEKRTWNCCRTFREMVTSQTVYPFPYCWAQVAFFSWCTQKKQMNQGRHFGIVIKSFRSAVTPNLEPLFCHLLICKLRVMTGPALQGCSARGRDAWEALSGAWPARKRSGHASGCSWLRRWYIWASSVASQTLPLNVNIYDFLFSLIFNFSPKSVTTV